MISAVLGSNACAQGLLILGLCVFHLSYEINATMKRGFLSKDNVFSVSHWPFARLVYFQ